MRPSGSGAWRPVSRSLRPKGGCGQAFRQQAGPSLAVARSGLKSIIRPRGFIRGSTAGTLSDTEVEA
jgi:hypothetical protein